MRALAVMFPHGLVHFVFCERDERSMQDRLCWTTSRQYGARLTCRMALRRTHIA